MKRDFLKDLKVGEAPLSDEVIDAIMAENGKDIENTKKSFADYDSIKEQLKAAQDGLKAFDGVDVAQLQGKITELTTSMKEMEEKHQKENADRDFRDMLKGAISTAKGKNDKAIMALLDLDTLRGSKNQADDVKKALEGLTETAPYLFGDDKGGTPPPYSGDAGGNHGQGGGDNKPLSLAGALHERYKN